MDDLESRIENIIEELDGILEAVKGHDDTVGDLQHELNCAEDEIEQYKTALENKHDFTRRHVIAMREAVERFDGPKYMRDDLKEVLKMVEAG